MPTREGWDYAQLKASFAGDPEFVRLARILGRRTPESYLAAIGLWTLCLAYSWMNDRPNVAEVLEGEPEEIVSALIEVGLITADAELRGFEKWTDRARSTRESNRDRQAEWRKKAVVSRVTNAESRSVTSREVEVEGERESENVDLDSSAPRADVPSGRQPDKVRGFARPFEEGSR